MSQRTRKPTRARVAAALTASVLAPALSLGFFAPSASAATMAGQKADGGSLLGNLCEMEDIGWDDQGTESLSCDANDIAGLLSGAVDPIFNLTCLDRTGNVIICRVDTDKAPDNNYAPGGGTRG